MGSDQHKNDYIQVSFTDIELKHGGKVADSNSQHVVWA